MVPLVFFSISVGIEWDLQLTIYPLLVYWVCLKMRHILSKWQHLDRKYECPWIEGLFQKIQTNPDKSSQCPTYIHIYIYTYIHIYIYISVCPAGNRGQCRLPSPSWILWWAYGPRMLLTSRKRSPWSSLQARLAPFRMDRFDHSHYMFSLIVINWY